MLDELSALRFTGGGGGGFLLRLGGGGGGPPFLAAAAPPETLFNVVLLEVLDKPLVPKLPLEVAGGVERSPYELSGLLPPCTAPSSPGSPNTSPPAP